MFRFINVCSGSSMVVPVQQKFCSDSSKKENTHGFGLALLIFVGTLEHLDLQSVPKGLKGTSIALITAGILAMAFMGFSGLV